ncbi:MAG: VTT domain-containing protein [Methanospirillaceae archaeon]|nr:VTT domain-containing protein [Methanospirillaceae archaeon]
MFGLITGSFEFLLHLDDYLPALVSMYGDIIYSILFCIIFCETGLVITPFLPGDSLLFIAGTIAGLGGLNIGILLVSLYAAAIIGDSVNYYIGRRIGQKIIDMNLVFIRNEHVEKTQEYFSKYGPVTIIIARFAPFIRTLAPFFAGMGKMRYPTFLFYNVTGAILWVSTFLLAGYFLIHIPVVRDNMSLVAFIIIVISLFAVGSIVIEVIRFLKPSITHKP